LYFKNYLISAVLPIFLAIDATINCIDFGHIMVLACSFSNHFVRICLYCLNSTKFGQLILRKIIEVVAINTKFDFGWGSAPDPTGGAHSTPRPLAGF